MTKRIAFLRAVNLGKRKVANARLVEVFDELGFPGATTFVNSGNVVFDATGSRGDLERKIGDAIEADVGFEVTTYVRTVAEVRKALALEPFDLHDGDTWFVTFFTDPLTKAEAKGIEALSGDFDTLEVHGRDVHWLMKGKSSDSKLTKRDWEKVLGKTPGRAGTSRNTTMLRRLLAKIDD